MLIPAPLFRSQWVHSTTPCRSTAARHRSKPSALWPVEDAVSFSGSNSWEADIADLPPHLRHYGKSVRGDKLFSGPSLLAAESDEGSLEYKLRLSYTSPARFQQLVTQLKYRIAEVCVWMCGWTAVCMHVCLCGGSRVGKYTRGQKSRAGVVASLTPAWPIHSGGLLLSGPFPLLPRTLHPPTRTASSPLFLPPTLPGRRRVLLLYWC